MSESEQGWKDWDWEWIVDESGGRLRLFRFRGFFRGFGGGLFDLGGFFVRVLDQVFELKDFRFLDEVVETD
ncbi:MAG: hypothetical protein AAGC68_16635, partial [Verrucomicrobiota bacterium]